MNEIDSDNKSIAQSRYDSNKNSYKKRPIDIQVSLGEELVMSSRKTESKPYFFMVGNGNINNKLARGTDVMDFIKEMANMTPQELFVVDQMRDGLLTDTFEKIGSTGKTYDQEYLTNIAMVKMSNYENADQQKFKKGFKRLHEKNIVRRTKRSHYIFNPSFVIPKFYEKTLKQWKNAPRKTEEPV